MFMKFQVSGRPTGLCFGFIKTMGRLVSQHPHEIIICWGDRRSNLWRRDISPDYKITREETPKDFILQCEQLKNLLASLGVPQMQFPKEEADDIIAFLCQVVDPELRVKVFSNDHDMLQLVSDERNIVVVREKGDGESVEMNEQGVIDKYGISVYNLTEFFAMVGEKGDNIIGLKGVGPKTAAKIIKKETPFPSSNPLDKLVKQKQVQKNMELIELPSSHSNILIEENLLEINPEPDLDFVKNLRAQNQYGNEWYSSAIKIHQFFGGYNG